MEPIQLQKLFQEEDTAPESLVNLSLKTSVGHPNFQPTHKIQWATNFLRTLTLSPQ